MTYPGIDEFLIQFFCFINGLRSCLISKVIIIFCAVSSSNKMKDSFIPSISQLNCAPSCFIQNCLPNIFITVCLSIHDASIADNDSRLPCGISNIDKNIFKVHLQLHQACLKLNCIFKRHLWRLNKSTTVVENCGCFRNKKHSITNLFHVSLNC